MLKTTYKPSVPLPAGWTEHTAPSGHKYYYNASTKQSTYTRPEPVPAPEPEELQIDYNATAPDASLHATAQALDEFYRNSDPRKWPINQHQKHDNSRVDQQPPRSRRGHGGDRPKSKKAILGAEPWVLVTTRFGRRFVHNTETKQSLWKFPQDVMIAVIDLDRAEWEKKQAQQREKEQAVVEEAQQSGDGRDPEYARGRDVLKLANATQDESADEAGSSEYEEVEVTDDEDEEDAHEAGGKRPRLDETTSPGQHPTAPIEMNEDDIEWQLAQIEGQDDFNDDYYDDDGHLDNGDGEKDGDPAGTSEDNVALFRSLLDDFGISPFTTFDKIIQDLNLVEDRRYLALPNTRTRREVFIEWAKERVLAINAAKAASEAEDKNDPIISYLDFLHQHATPKLYWPEFKRKHRKEAVMKKYELSDKDRERLYRELTSKLKRPEAERRKELLALLKQHLGAASGGDTDNRVIPLALRKDVRYYILDVTRRDEIVSGFFDLMS
ncbi:hypothetical protein DV738_g1181, partial [Chaetothyriales sp. CBS 135597]